MALRSIQLCIVFTIGFHLAAATQERRAIPSQIQRLSVELKDPEDVIVAKGQSASLACAIQATNGNVDLVWLYNGSKIPLNDSRWELLDNGTLYIPKVTGKRLDSVEGLYQCLVKNSVGSLLSSAAKLSVATLSKEFQEQPTNVTVQEGRPVVLPCKIHSYPSGTVTWALNNQTLPQTARYVPLPSGALLITSTHSSDTGPYRCSVVNPILKNKARESIVGWLKVIPRHPQVSNDFAATPPVFLPLGTRLNITALVGEDVKLYCTADGWPLPSIYWIKETSPSPLRNSSLLTLWKVTAETTGKYTCIAKNRLGLIKQTFNVEIYQPPYFNNTLDSKTYVPPVTLRIQCNTVGIPEPKIYWLKNGERLSYNARQRYHQVNHVSTLVISNSVTQDIGFYQCVAENLAGKSWMAAQYVPRELIANTSPPQNVKCRPYNDTSICVYWKPPENMNTTAYVVYHFYTEADMEITTLTRLTYQMLENLNRSTNYTFYVRAFTTRVSDQSEHIICQTGTTGKRNLKVKVYNSTIVELHWSRISTDVSCDGSSSDYRVQWKRATQTFSYVEYVKQSSYYICDLEPQVLYQFRVMSVQTKSEDNSWVTFLTPEYLNSNNSTVSKNHETSNTAPYNLKAEYISSSSVNLTWSHNNNLNKHTDNFSICRIELHSNKSNCQTVLSTLNKFTFEDLHPGTIYEFRIQAKYVNNSSNFFSRAIEVYTLQEGPTIQEVKYRVLNSSSVCLKWKGPLTINGTKTKYIISYKNSSEGLVGKKININTSQHCWIPPPSGDNVFQTQLTQLNPESSYTVSVTLENTSVSYSIIVSTRHKINNSTVEEVEEDELYEQQKLGFILGIAISLCGVVSCVGCLVYSIKRRHNTNATPPLRANYYNGGGVNVTTAFGTLPVRHQETCAVDDQEIQTLIGENGMCHIPSAAPNDLDTKGGINFPNRQANGSVHHPLKTSCYIPNGHVHITENPQSKSKQPSGKRADASSAAGQFLRRGLKFQQNTKLRKFFLQTPPDASSLNESVDSSTDSSLNATQLTTLDISGSVLYRKTSSPLGPNG